MIDEENQHQQENVQASTSSTSNSGEVLGADAVEADPPGDVVDSTLSNEPTIDGFAVDSVPIDVIDSEQSVAATGLEALAQKDVELTLLKSQLEERTSQCVRIAADFDNYRKRTQREREELELQVKCSTINELLPVVDNFERARSHIKPQTEQETTIHKSYQSVYKQLVDCLKRIGVAPMRSEGKEFDPNLHEAVMRQPTDEYPEGTVMEELVRGYLLGERVLRHALVKVAAAPEPVITSEEIDQSGVSN